MDRGQTIQHVKEWMQIDGEIAELRRQTKVLNARKAELTKQLVGVMKEHQIDEFDLADGKLVRHTQKTRAGMTKSYLLTCFAKYFNGDSAPTKALSELVFNAREEKTSERIVCRKKK
jgi:hypothetical protein